MYGILRVYLLEISDTTDGCLAFDLSDVLDAIGPAALEMDWTCDVEEGFAKPDVADLEFYAAYNSAPVSGSRLRELAERTLQIVDGEFRATQSGATEPYVVIRAIDSTCWEVATNSTAIAESVRARFSSVVDRPPDAV